MHANRRLAPVHGGSNHKFTISVHGARWYSGLNRETSCGYSPTNRVLGSTTSNGPQPIDRSFSILVCSASSCSSNVASGIGYIFGGDCSKRESRRETMTSWGLRGEGANGGTVNRVGVGGSDPWGRLVIAGAWFNITIISIHRSQSTYCYIYFATWPRSWCTCDCRTRDIGSRMWQKLSNLSSLLQQFSRWEEYPSQYVFRGYCWINVFHIGEILEFAHKILKHIPWLEFMPFPLILTFSILLTILSFQFISSSPPQKY